MELLKNGRVFGILPKVSIKFSIVTNFVLGTSAVILSLIFLQFVFSKELTVKSVNKSFSDISESVLNRIEYMDDRIFDLIVTNQYNPIILEKPDFNKRHKALKLFTDIINRNRSLYSLYVGFEDGGFYEVINLRSSDSLYKKYKVTKDNLWLVVKIEGGKKGVRKLDFLDKDLNILSSKVENTDYDPTKRPWFIEARNSKEIIKTDPYNFSNLDGKGVTYSKNLGKAVLSTDISLESMVDFLESLKITEDCTIYLMNGSKDIMYSTKNFDVASIRKKPEILDNVMIFEQKGKNYLSVLRAIKTESGTQNKLGIIVSQDELLKPYMEKLKITLYVSLGLFFFALPVIYFGALLITNPIKRLMFENEKIKTRKYNDVIQIESAFTEINALSRSLINMAEEISANEYSQKILMDSFFSSIASTLDVKSAYSASHSKRVTEIATLIAKSASESQETAFNEFQLNNEDEWREFRTGATLHDCGKIITPEYVIDKATKLETIYNRIHEIRTRFEVLYRDAKIDYLENKISKEELEERFRGLKEDFEFIAEVNQGGEFLDAESIERIKKIGSRKWTRNFDKTIGLSYEEQLRIKDLDIKTPDSENLLGDLPEHIVPRKESEGNYSNFGFKKQIPKNKFNLGEIYNLSVSRGTLTEEERFIINEHVMMTIKMLESLPFPEDLTRVSEYAGSHHETLNGTGYPRELTEKELSIPSRIIAIADMFEALTAPDRPYKEPMKISKALEILSYDAKNRNIDPEIFKLFVTNKIYEVYGRKHLTEEQMDEVDIEKILEKLG